MQNKEPDSNSLPIKVLNLLLKVDTWHKVGMLIVLVMGGVIAFDFVVYKAAVQRELISTLAGSGKRPILFPEDLKYINSVIKKYPGSNISVVELIYLAGIEGKPLTDLNTAERLVINRAGSPIAVILVTPNTPFEAKREIIDYFKGYDNIRAITPLPTPSSTLLVPDAP